ncbi:MAG: hypothetical protein AAFO06_11340 [Cyanobacteria bacterium J06597_16]
MSAFDPIEEDIRRREESLKARELKMRLKEIEKELDNIPNQSSTQPSAAEHVHAEVVSDANTRRLYKKATDIGKFCLVVVSVIVAIRLAAWVGTIVMVLGITWMAYKLFLESKA